MWYILWQFGIFYGKFGIFYGYVVYFMSIWYILWQLGIVYGPIFTVLVCMDQEKSGNSAKTSRPFARRLQNCTLYLRIKCYCRKPGDQMSL
jgi:hypothetical protein